MIPANYGRRIIFGSNRTVWNKFDAAMPAGVQRCVRVYYDWGQFPPYWPNHTGKAWILLSLRPTRDPEKLLNGSLDSKLKAIIRTAPAHSMLTFYHENEPGNPLGYPRAICNATTARAIQEHGQRLCRDTQVGFGVVICAPADQISHWMAPRLDWYAYDRYLVPRYLTRYGTLDVPKLYGQMDSDYDVFRSLSGRRWPEMAFPETNAPHDDNRAHWFTALAEWSAEHNCHRIMTRWDGGQGLSGHWPPSRSVVNTLRHLSLEYRF